MSNNLHVSYDLRDPQRNYPAVIAKVKSLGKAVRANKSFWYVKSALTAEQARNAIKSALDADDRLYVVDATNNEAAWYNLEAGAADFISQNWLNGRSR